MPTPSTPDDDEYTIDDWVAEQSAFAVSEEGGQLKAAVLARLKPPPLPSSPRKLDAIVAAWKAEVAALTTVITPTLPGRDELLAEAVASVRAAGFTQHLIEVDTLRAGPAQVRNALARRADTPWLLFLDDDDTLMGHYATAISPYLADADVVYTAWELAGWGEWAGREASKLGGPYPLDRFDARLMRVQNFIPVTAMVRASVFAKVGGFPPDAPEEDWVLWRTLYAAGARFVCVPIPAWTYRQWPGSRSALAKAAGRL